MQLTLRSSPPSSDDTSSQNTVCQRQLISTLAAFLGLLGHRTTSYCTLPDNLKRNECIALLIYSQELHYFCIESLQCPILSYRCHILAQILTMIRRRKHKLFFRLLSAYDIIPQSQQKSWLKKKPQRIKAAPCRLLLPQNKTVWKRLDSPNITQVQVLFASKMTLKDWGKDLHKCTWTVLNGPNTLNQTLTHQAVVL